MVTFFAAFVLSTVVAAALTLGIRNVAIARGWLDQGGVRKVHVRPIPRLGGVAVVVGFFAPLTALLVVDSGVGALFRYHEPLVYGLFGGGLLIALLGLFDDLRGAGARLKLSVQVAVALGLWFLGFRVEVIANPFGEELALGWLALPFTVLWVVGVVNAMNLIDGLDGLAGGVAFIGIATNFALALSRGDVLMCLIMAALAGAALGFLLFNFNPASIFMGDTGSMFLGFVLAAVSLKTSTKSGTAVAMLVPIIALGLPIMDTFLAVFRRTLAGRPIFSADKEHIHHRLMSRQMLSHRNAVLALYALCCLFALVALALNHANSRQSALLLTGVGVVVIVLMRKLGYLTLTDVQGVGHTRRRNVELRSMVRGRNEAIRNAQSLQDLWDAVRPLSEAFGLSALELRFDVRRGDSVNGTVFETRVPAGFGLPRSARFEVRGPDEAYGALTLSWSDGRLSLAPEEALAVELIADSLAKAAARWIARAVADPAKVVAIR